MEMRQQRGRTETGDGDGTSMRRAALAGAPAAEDDVVVLPETPVVARARRRINWGAPNPAERVAAHQPERSPLPRRPLRHRLLTAAMVLSFAAMTLAIIAAAVDWGARVYEMDALLDEIEVSEGIMLGAQDRVAEIVAGDPETADGGDTATREELQRVAAEASIALAESAERIAAVRLLAWHDRSAAARSAYLAHSAAWQEYLSAASEDATQWFQLYPQIDLTWEALAPQLRSAVPVPTVGGIDARVAEILGGSEEEPETVPLDA